jgi:hypothetical protein
MGFNSAFKGLNNIMFWRLDLTQFQVGKRKRVPALLVHWKGAASISGPPVFNKPIGQKMSKTLAKLLPIYHCQNSLKWFQGLSASNF